MNLCIDFAICPFSGILWTMGPCAHARQASSKIWKPRGTAHIFYYLKTAEKFPKRWMYLSISHEARVWKELLASLAIVPFLRVQHVVALTKDENLRYISWPKMCAHSKREWKSTKANCSLQSSQDTSSTAQGGGGSFENRKPIGEVGCCESGMAERIHWLTERWLELCSLEWLQWLQWSPHPQLLDVVWCTATVVVVVA